MNGTLINFDIDQAGLNVNVDFICLFIISFIGECHVKGACYDF